MNVFSCTTDTRLCGCLLVQESSSPSTASSPLLTLVVAGEGTEAVGVVADEVSPPAEEPAVAGEPLVSTVN